MRAHWHKTVGVGQMILGHKGFNNDLAIRKVGGLEKLGKSR